MASLRNRAGAADAAALAANAAGALRLAIQGMAAICEHSQPGAAMIDALEWLASFTADAAEASNALAHGMPPRWVVFRPQLEVAAAIAAMPPLQPVGTGEGGCASPRSSSAATRCGAVNA